MCLSNVVCGVDLTACIVLRSAIAAANDDPGSIVFHAAIVGVGQLVSLIVTVKLIDWHHQSEE